MPDPVTDRLTARLEHLQIERLVRVESIADDAAAVVAAAVDRVLSITVGRKPLPNKQIDIANTLRVIPEQLNVVIERQFVRLAYWSQAEFVRVMARTIPRPWFRLVNPVVILAGEDEEKPIPIPGIQVPEPALAVLMSDDEWAVYLARNVFPPPDRDAVLEIIHRPNAGVDYRERITGLSKLVDPDRTAGAIAQGLSDGENIQQLTTRMLDQVTGRVKSSAKRIARTEGLRVANEMQRDSYNDLGDLSVGVQIMETLDQVTRPHHALRHGTNYYSDGRQPTVDEMPRLPDEPNCRGWDRPILDYPDDVKNDPELSSIYNNASGHAIPDPQEYSQWWAGTDDGRRKVSVGTGRFNTMVTQLDGVRPPEWEDFIHPDGKRLKIADLKKETTLEREARRQEVFKVIQARTDQLARVR